MKTTFLEFVKAFKKTIIIWAVLGILIAIGYYFGVPKKILGGSVIAIGWITGAFAGLMAMFALVPVIGPIVVSVLSLPVIWLLNGLGYFVSIVAIKKGYTKEVVNTRVLTVVLIVGIVIGYIVHEIVDYVRANGSPFS